MSTSAIDVDPMPSAAHETASTDTALELQRARAEIAELTAFIRHIDVATQRARRERDRALAELAELRASTAGQAATAVHRSIDRALPNGSIGRGLCRQVTQRIRRAAMGIGGKVSP